jgi:hypothetical protein
MTSATILGFLLPAIEAHQARRWNSAPETTIFPDDRFYDWAEKVVYSHEDTCREFMLKATNDDMTQLFAALTDGFPASAGKCEVWPAHRRAFATKLFQFAVELEDGGLEVSQGFAAFYRERYNPQHKFRVELPVLPAGSVVPPVEKEETTPSAEEK